MFENHDIAQRFVRALRSGAYAQARGALRVDDEFCALGVLCDLVAPNGWARRDLNADFPHAGPALIWEHDWCGASPSEAILKKCGLTQESANRIAMWNDRGQPFDWIAGFIEAEGRKGAQQQ